MCHSKSREVTIGSSGSRTKQHAKMRKPVQTRTLKQDRELVPILLEAYKGDEGTVAEFLGRGRRFVSTWKLRHEAGLGSGNKPGAGRPRTLSNEAVSAAKRKATGVIAKSATQIAESLFQNELTEHVVHPTTVLRWLKTGRSPVRYLPSIRRHKLTTPDKAKRLRWARRHQGVDWDRVLFTDSHIFQVGQPTARKRQQRVNARK